MIRKSFAGMAAILMAAFGLGACHAQHNIEGTQSQYLNVAGKRMKADLKPAGVPGEFDLLIVRDAMVVNPDPETRPSVARRRRRGSCARCAASKGSIRRCWITSLSGRSTTTCASGASEGEVPQPQLRKTAMSPRMPPGRSATSYLM